PSPRPRRRSPIAVPWSSARSRRSRCLSTGRSRRGLDVPVRTRRLFRGCRLPPPRFSSWVTTFLFILFPTGDRNGAQGFCEGCRIRGDLPFTCHGNRIVETPVF